MEPVIAVLRASVLFLPRNHAFIAVDLTPSGVHKDKRIIQCKERKI
jgi:hypothetical protein